MIDALWKQENYKVAVKTVSNTIENEIRLVEDEKI